MTLDRQSFLSSKPLSASYKPGVVGYAASWTDHRGWFSIYDIERMRRDPRIRLCLRTLLAPLSTVTWEVKARSAEVQQWLDRTLRRLWTNHLTQLGLVLCFPGMGAEVLWREDEETATIEFDALKDFHPFDTRPLECGGKLAGISVSGIKAEAGRKPWLLRPRSFWLALDPEFGQFYGRPRLQGAWYPWQEKTARHGAIDIRRLWYLKNSFRGARMRHPPGSIEVAPGVFQTCQDYAREIVEKFESGGVLTLPSAVDPDTKQPLWDWDDPAPCGDLPGVREYTGDLDTEITVGMEIPPEVLEMAEGGGGWSGRSVPFLSFLTGEDGIAHQFINAAKAQVLEPGVEVNFGAQAFEVIPKSLVPAEAEGQAKGQDGRQPGGAALGGLGDLFGSAQLSADVVRLADEWSPFTGQHGGRGWKNGRTGEVRYQNDRPSPHEGQGLAVSRSEAPGPRDAAATGTTDDKPNADGSPKRGSKAWQAVRGVVTGAILKGSNAKEAASRAARAVGEDVWKATPEGDRKIATALYQGAMWVEHKLSTFKSVSQAAVGHLARQWGASEPVAQAAQRAAKLADGIAAWTVNIPFTHARLHEAGIHGTGGFLGAKLGYYVPVGSLAFLATASVANPMKVLRAAKAAIKEHRAGKGHAEGKPVQMAADGSFPEQLLKAFQGHEGDLDSFEALYYAGLDEGSPSEALAQAEEISGGAEGQDDAHGKLMQAFEAGLKIGGGEGGKAQLGADEPDPAAQIAQHVDNVGAAAEAIRPGGRYGGQVKGQPTLAHKLRALGGVDNEVFDRLNNDQALMKQLSESGMFIHNEYIRGLSDTYSQYLQDARSDPQAHGRFANQAHNLGVSMESAANVLDELDLGDEATFYRKHAAPLAHAISKAAAAGHLSPVRLGADNWTVHEGPRGGSGWKNTATGEIRYQEARPGTREEERKNRPTVEHAHAAIKQAQAERSAESVEQLRQRLGQMSKADLTELKKSLGLRAGGNKSELAAKVAKQATAIIGEREHWAREARKAGVPPAAMRQTARQMRSVAGEYVADVQRTLRQARRMYRSLVGKALTRNHPAFRGKDPDSIKEFDVIARSLGTGLLGDLESGDAPRRLYDLLYAGPPRLPGRSQFYAEAIEHLRGQAAHQGRRQAAADEEVPF